MDKSVPLLPAEPVVSRIRVLIDVSGKTICVTVPWGELQFATALTKPLAKAVGSSLKPYVPLFLFLFNQERKEGHFLEKVPLLQQRFFFSCFLLLSPLT